MANSQARSREVDLVDGTVNFRKEYPEDSVFLLHTPITSFFEIETLCPRNMMLKSLDAHTPIENKFVLMFGTNNTSLITDEYH